MIGRNTSRAKKNHCVVNMTWCCISGIYGNKSPGSANTNTIPYILSPSLVSSSDTAAKSPW